MMSHQESSIPDRPTTPKTTRARHRLLRRLLGVGAMVVLLAVALLAGLYAYGGIRTVNVLFRGGGLLWTTVEPDDARLSAGMRLALRDRNVIASPGSFEWRQIAPGFEVAELPVLAEGGEVDRIMLARVEPGHFRFIVRTAPAGTRVLDEWMTALGAALVINGSYFERDGLPATPLVSARTTMGPRDYQARHGAFVASPQSIGIRDLANEDWRSVLTGADDAMVSHPLLIANDGAPRVKANWRWLANRSFVGQDDAGRILLGTTTDAFFSLERLAHFLRAAPLGLTLALNLDGGPVASQGIALNGFARKTCGNYELATQDDRLTLLYGPRMRLLGPRCWEMPIVLAVVPK
jgi:hypothetical protein